MDSLEFIDGFQLKDQSVLYENVYTMSTVQPSSLVLYR